MPVTLAKTTDLLFYVVTNDDELPKPAGRQGWLTPHRSVIAVRPAADNPQERDIQHSNLLDAADMGRGTLWEITATTAAMAEAIVLQQFADTMKQPVRPITPVRAPGTTFLRGMPEQTSHYRRYSPERPKGERIPRSQMLWDLSLLLTPGTTAEAHGDTIHVTFPDGKKRRYVPLPPK